jgi:hypothetical protein
MSLRITVTDEQTGETEIRRIAEGRLCCNNSTPLRSIRIWQ